MKDRTAERQMISLMSIRDTGSWVLHGIAPGEEMSGGDEIDAPVDGTRVRDATELGKAVERLSGRVALLWTSPKGLSEVVAVYDLR